MKAKGLKVEAPAQAEFDGLLQSGRTRLHDARNTANSIESRFVLAYNAAHSVALAALRWHGYRSENRYIVFQVMPDTLGIENKHWLVLDLCHRRRNLSEYEGRLEVDEKLLAELIEVTELAVLLAEALGPAPQAIT